MTLIRKSTVTQLDRIEKEIKKQGGSLDLTVPSEHTGANGLWIHDPFEASRKGKRKIATIDDHMTIDIPESNKVLKFAEFNKINENNNSVKVNDCIETAYEYSDLPIGSIGYIVDINEIEKFGIYVNEYIIKIINDDNTYALYNGDFVKLTDSDKIKNCKKTIEINKFNI